MKTISDYPNPFDAIVDFEDHLSEFTGAPYVVTTDCCSHAIELCFRYLKTQQTSLPYRTYLSVPMTLHKLGINYEYTTAEWFDKGEYRFDGTPVWDSARRLTQGMYKSGMMQCISFGRSKPIELGKGGAILLDDYDAYKALLEMRYDGRQLDVHPWVEQKVFNVGYHYYMRPEECVDGLNKLVARDFVTQEEKFFNYPDCRSITIQD